MNLGFIRQLGLAFSAVVLTTLVVVVTRAQTEDSVPVVSVSEIPLSPVVPPAVSSEIPVVTKGAGELEKQYVGIITRLPEVEPIPVEKVGTKPASILPHTPTLPEASDPKQKSIVSKGESLTADQQKPKAIVLPDEPRVPDAEQAANPSTAANAQPVSVVEAVTKVDLNPIANKIPVDLVTPGNFGEDQLIAEPSSKPPRLQEEVGVEQETLNTALTPRIKKLPVVVQGRTDSSFLETSIPKLSLRPRQSSSASFDSPKANETIIEPMMIGKIRESQTHRVSESMVANAFQPTGPLETAGILKPSLKVGNPDLEDGQSIPTPSGELDASASIVNRGVSSRRGAETLSAQSLGLGSTSDELLGLKSSVLNETIDDPLTELPGLGYIPPLNATADGMLYPTMIKDGEVILDGELEPVSEEMSVINECCRGCPQRTYLVAEGLVFRRDGERTQLSSGFKLDGFGSQEGMRFTLGRRSDCLNGWEASYSVVEPWYAYDSASSPDGNLQAAFQPGKGFKHDDLDTFYNANYQEQFYRSELHNIELNRTRWGWDVLTHTLGLRYMILNEDMRFTSLKGSDRADLEIETNNHLIGPQFGSELFYDVGGRFYLSSRYRLGAFANVNDGAVQYTSEDSPLSSFINTDQNIGFSFLGDLQVNAFYKLGARSRLRAGYELWYAWGLATAKGNLGPGVGPSMGANMDDTSDVLFHGLSVGFEFVR